MNLGSDIRNVVFENDANIIACATSYGFSLFDAGTSQNISTCRIKSMSNGTRLISVLGNSNIVAITASTDPSQNVYIWDIANNTALSTITYNDSIWGIRLRPDILVAATSKSIFVNSLSDSSIITTFNTAFNKDGIFDIPATISSSLIAYPSPDIGVVTICDYLDPSFTPLNVHAFKTPVSFIKFSDNGRLLAVAGDDGKNIIVYSVPSMKKIAFLKRTTASSRILSMSFEPHGTQLAVSSANGMTHVFFIAWADSSAEQDPKAARNTMRIKDAENHISWLYFSAKTLKLCGITSNGQHFRIVFDDQMKQATLDMSQTPLNIK
ncbi:WD repeat domain phosphoinositide-interacting protein 3 [Histomonas meleagridis]|uniref:WD repeat domain phosphoinositide-interacting protein 3 n=1 Tax=Histomonas meleagridis TaxID=135588 RepID=UPI00355A3889|nr:WD repeat domain phosphoinositide-interacting protein 3 [Histomonas meleagridis]KAH0796449.1 WD repeat domain phosphoinositide-interacting protein 3 [Histomonas meleagridis]